MTIKKKKNQAAYIILALAIASMLLFVTTACDDNGSSPALSGRVTITAEGGKFEVNKILNAGFNGNVSASALSWQWNKNGEAVTDAPDENEFIPDTEGEYSVTVSAAGFNNAITSASVTVVDPAKSLIFVDCPDFDPDNISREFLIDAALNFRVRFFDAFFETLDEHLLPLFEILGSYNDLVVYGVIKDTDDALNSETITGTAQDMTSNNDNLTGIFKSGTGVALAIKLELEMEDNEITTVAVEFTGEEDFAEVSSILMGGIYYRVND